MVDKIARDVSENEDKYLAAPDKFEIHEYRMMEDFCYSLEDQKKANKLLSAIRGKGAFRRFKDMGMELRRREEWFAYRDNRYKEIAIAFCEGNGLNYTEKKKGFHVEKENRTKRPSKSNRADEGKRLCQLLVKMDRLTPKQVGDWRLKRIPYLEQVTNGGLGKLDHILNTLKKFALEQNLKLSLTVYKSWGKRPKKKMRFSKSGSSYDSRYLTMCEKFSAVFLHRFPEYDCSLW